MTFAELVALAEGAGLPPDRAQTAAAVSLAEAGGRPDAHCFFCVKNAQYPNGVPEDSRGLWQINVLGNPWAAHKYSNLYDPAQNAAAMADLSRGGTNFGDWTQFTNGAYKAFLPGGSASTPLDPRAASAGVSGSSPFPNLNPGGFLGGILSAFGVNFGDLLIRFILIVMGLLFLLMGVLMLFRQSPVSVVSKLAPAAE